MPKKEPRTLTEVVTSLFLGGSGSTKTPAWDEAHGRPSDMGVTVHINSVSHPLHRRTNDSTAHRAHNYRLLDLFFSFFSLCFSCW